MTTPENSAGRHLQSMHEQVMCEIMAMPRRDRRSPQFINHAVGSIVRPFGDFLNGQLLGADWAFSMLPMGNKQPLSEVALASGLFFSGPNNFYYYGNSSELPNKFRKHKPYEMGVLYKSLFDKKEKHWFVDIDDLVDIEDYQPEGPLHEMCYGATMLVSALAAENNGMLTDEHTRQVETRLKDSMLIGKEIKYWQVVQDEDQVLAGVQGATKPVLHRSRGKLIDVALARDDIGPEDEETSFSLRFVIERTNKTPSEDAKEEFVIVDSRRVHRSELLASPLEVEYSETEAIKRRLGKLSLGAYGEPWWGQKEGLIIYPKQDMHVPAVIGQGDGSTRMSVQSVIPRNTPIAGTVEDVGIMGISTLTGRETQLPYLVLDTNGTPRFYALGEIARYIPLNIATRSVFYNYRNFWN